MLVFETLQQRTTALSCASAGFEESVSELRCKLVVIAECSSRFRSEFLTDTLIKRVPVLASIVIDAHDSLLVEFTHACDLRLRV